MCVISITSHLWPLPSEPTDDVEKRWMEKNESVDDDDGFSQSALYVCVCLTRRMSSSQMKTNQMFPVGEAWTPQSPTQYTWFGHEL